MVPSLKSFYDLGIDPFAVIGFTARELRDLGVVIPEVIEDEFKLTTSKTSEHGFKIHWDIPDETA